MTQMKNMNKNNLLWIDTIKEDISKTIYTIRLAIIIIMRKMKMKIRIKKEKK